MNKTTKILLESGTNELELAEFRLTKKNHQGMMTKNSYGINVAKVREVIRFPEIIDYPKGGDYVIGVFNSRGKVAPLIHLSKWLGFSEDVNPDKQLVIVTDFNGVVNGFLIDDINRIHRVSWDQMESPEKISVSDENDCIVATIYLDKKLVFVLDFEQIIANINEKIDMRGYDIDLDPNVDLSEYRKEIRSQHTILLADDSRFILEQLNDVIANAGYNTILTSDGEAAWDAYLDKGHVISAVIADVEMPKMDGLHLCKKVNEVNSSIPIIIFSSTMTPENRLKALSVGASETITKPCINQLIPTLDKFILNK